MGRKFEKGNTEQTKKIAANTIGKYIRQCVGDDFKTIVDQLLKIADNEKNSLQNRMKAMELLMDRGLGKPHQSVSEEIVSHNVVITNLPPATSLSDWEKQVEQARIARGVTAIGTTNLENNQ
jgi:hypothetical protein